MKLYKICRMIGDHSTSMFAPTTTEVPTPEVMAGEPMMDLIRKLMIYGYTEQQAYYIIQAWAAHAKFDLNQAARGVRVYCEMNMSQLPHPEAIAAVSFWPIVLAVAAVVVVGAGLYLWVELGVEQDVIFSGHPWAYVMTYEEKLWQGEVYHVFPDGRAVYEKWPVPLGSMVILDRRVRYVGYYLDQMWFYGALVHEGRPTIFYHRFPWTLWEVCYCGVLESMSYGMYRLREGGRDRFLPPGPWYRPGGRIGTPEYEGCWKDWWWL